MAFSVYGILYGILLAKSLENYKPLQAYEYTFTPSISLKHLDTASEER